MANKALKKQRRVVEDRKRDKISHALKKHKVSQPGEDDSGLGKLFCNNNVKELSAPVGTLSNVKNILALFERRFEKHVNKNPWKRRTHNRARALSDLCRHLFAKYPMPLFLDSLWRDVEPKYDHTIPNRLFEKWIRLAQGDNIRNIEPNIPWTKRMAHLFMQAPSTCDYVSAIRRAQVFARKPDQRLADAVSSSFLNEINDSESEVWWDEVIHWFTRQDFLDYTQVSPMLDFIRWKKAQEPEMSMAGRSALRLHRDMLDWHAQLNRMRPRGRRGVDNSPFSSSGFKGFNSVGLDQVYGTSKQMSFSFEELLTPDQLLIEGRLMKHCVYSYAGYIRQGHASVWSLRGRYDNDDTTEYRISTIEVNLKTNSIVQCRGPMNRAIYPWERMLINNWAIENRLDMRV